MPRLLARLFAAYVIFATGSLCEADRPNIVLIVVDDMGYGDPGCFNPQSKISTPHIDSLARAGMRFTDAHAPGPLCHMSRYGMLTGQYPFRTDVTVWPSQPLIQSNQMTIASLAHGEGYSTAMVGKWHLGFHETGYDKPLRGGPVDRGFDSFFGIRASTDIPPYFYIRGDRAVALPTDHIAGSNSQGWSPIQGVFWRAGDIAPDLNLKDVLPRFTEEAVAVIQKHQRSAVTSKSPLMLYLAYPAPHTPWLPTEEYAGKSNAGLYGDFLTMVDAEVGRVIEALEKAEMSDDTLVIFTSDNGPVWRDADIDKFDHRSTASLRGMKGDAWEGGHRMPLIVRWPGYVAENSVSDQLVCFTDFLATFASIMGVELPPHAGSDSFSFLPAMTGSPSKQAAVRNQFVMRAGSLPTMMTIRSGDWKLITQLGSGGFSKPKYIEPSEDAPAGQLYNLAEDLGETRNRYQDYPEIVSQLTRELKQIVNTGESYSSLAEQPSRQAANENAVDRSTLDGKVMCGYQGWFNCEGDGADLGWTHWGRRGVFGPDSVTVDLWPDVSGFSKDELYPTGFKRTDGRTASVFSSRNRKTVVRHFQWMREYGIDGAFLQRFATELQHEARKLNRDVVLENVRAGARQAGRSYAVMYDLSGLPAGGVKTVLEDWKKLQSDLQLTDDEAYQYHDGKPVVAVWGVGFSGKNNPRKYSLAECRDLIEGLKNEDCSVMLGIPTGWRTQTRDAMTDPQLHAVLKLADIVSPWTVGRYRNQEEVERHMRKHWRPDKRWCDQNELEYMPVVFPGFSWHNLHGGKLREIPRQKGEFLWSQIVAVKEARCNMLYVAMFDEVDEGTAIFKCTNQPPTANGGKFIDYEGLPSDFYLHLVGLAGKVLRGEIPRTTTIPASVLP